MKTIYKVKKTVLIFFAGLILACGAETVLGTVFLPLFAATWPVAGETEYRIDLQPDADNQNVESGMFEGVEEHDSDPTKRDSLFGSFNGLNIEFTIRRPAGGVQYTGTMTPVSETDHNITRIVLTSSEGDLVLGEE